MGGQVFQCLPSCDSLNRHVFTPNIPDYYFDDSTAASFSTGSVANLTVAQGGFTHFFTIPPLSSAERNCRGTVVALRYCYRANNNLRMMRERVIFEFLYVNQNQLQPRMIQKRIMVKSKVRANICTFARGVQQICCDNYTLTESNQFQISTSSYFFGINILNSLPRPLMFRNDFNVQHYKKPSIRGRRYMLSNRDMVNEPLLLLRFSIGKYKIT